MTTDSQKLYIGIDVGGTKLALNAIFENRQPVSSTWVEVPSFSHLGPSHTVAQALVGLKTFLKEKNLSLANVAAIGIDSPGPANLNGRITQSANMHPDWDGFELRDAIEAAATKELARKIPVSYENDCNAAALWEGFLNDPDGHEIVALLAPGTGLGGGIAIHGRLLRGARGMSAELGHVEIVHPEFTPGSAHAPCGCGQTYCAESYASMAALMKLLPAALAQEKYKNHPLNQITGDDVWRKRAYQVRSLAAQGDELCQSIFDWQSQAIGKLCRQLADTIDPTRIIIGGGFIEGGQNLTDRIMRVIRETFQKLAFRVHAQDVKIEVARSGDQAGCLGAALSAWQLAHKSAR